ncbi:hypothetical protein CAL12_19965 [Bordetella genomosp. 8]|uniref:RNA polymerase subunit sigma n=1 Tax=Bordetella genomosp. 8 TaxID=1416806 RepID=A0A1W6YU76_9BORD|nr:hypothetical protein CAL12_19965 [Bordetella genomosp. 8]
MPVYAARGRHSARAAGPAADAAETTAITELATGLRNAVDDVDQGCAGQPDWAPLVRAVARDRDRASFMCIYDYYAPRLGRYLEGLGVPAGLAEELVQEALFKLWQKADQYDPARSTLSTWLYRITRNLYIDHYRNEKGWTAVQVVLDEFEATDTSSAEEEASEQALRAALASLPAQQARIVEMCYFQAKSHGQIAEDLSMPLGTVKSSIRLAFKKLRTLLTD